MLIATTPAPGHVVGVFAVARELVRRGHEVRWYTGEVFRARVERTGARFEPMRAGLDFGGRSREEAFPEHAGLTGLTSFTTGIRDIFYRTAPGQSHDLLAVLDRFPADCLLADDMCYGACFAAERTGTPLAWVNNSVYILGSRDTPPLGWGLLPNASPLGRVRDALLRRLTDRIVMRGLRREADRARALVGLDRLRTAALENIARPPDLYLMGTVPSFEFPRADLLPGTHFVGGLLGPPPDDPFDPPGWWEELRGGDRPVVLITQGTTANDVGRLLVPAVRALADLDALVVVTTGSTLDVDRLRPLPGNVRLERFVPYHHLLPHVAVMVTNGGYNGVNAALAQGVPLVVAPGSEENPDVAARVAWTGAGAVLGRRAVSEARLRAAVTAVLHDGRYRRRARALAREHRGRDAPRRAAELIESLAGAPGQIPIGGVTR
ncbi:glycosyltransferase [Streptomyces clavuligerus]|uniref:Staurosporine biosynthesis N-glycosyltransferase StaG n=1 Tax=Streptomyces clavuligerus TaxID=1901 RepID=D5SL11_STRCL|nr:nucleotide disphospho-sugar-binding domain-containing protein [Streptomyces clavuligerus]AXU17003.1 glycosyltransferase [Streptomyces clavuligerus]EFG04604.1 Staurosporine biosynthesis N-glycosyltransferase StaG [Streptomyces clavuligerus]MBY6306948.1 glycosyltransferase [Streptomyces clavuligerus]QCS10466.1 glycosyltransferase [Streptomyces clavuligerus]QPJ97493.1 glycosyltransferase [Streptomyces clavuligerus]